MNTSLILFGVQSIVRLGRVSRDVAEQRARDAKAVFPHLVKQNLTRKMMVQGFFNSTPELKAQVAADGPLADFWDGAVPKSDPDAIDQLYMAALRISTEQGVDFAALLTPSGAVMLQQFDPGEGPLSPFARIVLAAADVALDYLALDPGIATDDPNTQKLIAGFARSMADFLPDDAQFGPQHEFGERLAAGFLRAGLATVSSHPGWVVDQDHYEALLKNAVTPVVEQFPTSITERLQWSRVTDAILGPAAQAALETVAAHQTAFLGDNLDPDQALGAVVQALLMEAAEDGLRDQVRRDGLIGLYRAVLGVAATRPELFFEGNKPEAALARDALKRFSGTLAAVKRPPFDKGTGLALAAVAIEVVGLHAHRFANPADEWVGVAITVFEDLTSDLSGALRANEGLGNVLSVEQLTDIGRIVLTEISKNPTLITSSGEEWHGVIQAVAFAMAADVQLLLTADDWKQIASVAAAEAATNPARLFRLGQSPEDQLAAKVIGVLLTGATDVLAAPNGPERSVLAGPVLTEAITIALRAASGNADAVARHLQGVQDLVTALNKLTVEHPMAFGSKEWLHLFRILLTSVLEGTDTGALTLERAIELLRGG